LAFGTGGFEPHFGWLQEVVGSVLEGEQLGLFLLLVFLDGGNQALDLLDGFVVVFEFGVHLGQDVRFDCDGGVEGFEVLLEFHDTLLHFLDHFDSLCAEVGVGAVGGYGLLGSLSVCCALDDGFS
jgi:hypothetical protein